MATSALEPTQEHNWKKWIKNHTFFSMTQTPILILPPPSQPSFRRSIPSLPLSVLRERRDYNGKGRVCFLGHFAPPTRIPRLKLFMEEGREGRRGYVRRVHCARINFSSFFPLYFSRTTSLQWAALCVSPHASLFWISSHASLSRICSERTSFSLLLLLFMCSAVNMTLLFFSFSTSVQQEIRRYGS